MEESTVICPLPQCPAPHPEDGAPPAGTVASNASESEPSRTSPGRQKRQLKRKFRPKSTALSAGRSAAFQKGSHHVETQPNTLEPGKTSRFQTPSGRSCRQNTTCPQIEVYTQNNPLIPSQAMGALSHIFSDSESAMEPPLQPPRPAAMRYSVPYTHPMTHIPTMDELNAATNDIKAKQARRAKAQKAIPGPHSGVTRSQIMGRIRKLLAEQSTADVPPMTIGCDSFLTRIVQTTVTQILSSQDV